jgi:peroxiredoxin
VVLNFWSSTCPICTTELPALQKASQSGDKRSVILGVDVSDPPSAAEAFINRAGTTYPMLADASGATAGQFRLPGLPYTVILSPTGAVVVRHPGAITTEQLEYLLQTLETESPNG